MSFVLLQTANGIAEIVINKPETLNALNSLILNELEKVINNISKDDDIKLVIITGQGSKSFAAGADINEMKDLNPQQAREFSRFGHTVFKTIENLQQITIAAINGYALGGGLELALACDLRTASKTAKFGLPEVSLGITPGYGGTQRLQRIVGMSHAKEMIFTGEMIDANEAYRIGLVNKVYEQDELLPCTRLLAQKILSNSMSAVSLAKASINYGIQCGLDSACQYETEIFSLCFSTRDRIEGINAFIEKRKPQFGN
ncbi:MAG: enoyl-CoA hydratase-related protein [Tepidanaerobacteraceae bacterium]|nr:enoyl-CoA hydratase-related protein [Tepidanaerobacteraceae bacterium]